MRGLIDILSSYNFTIDENDPNDADVALDPELLGKVFENLLASFNPETATTARKATGSYYTPREIVNYMVDESLTAYLSNVIDPNSCHSPVSKYGVNSIGNPENPPSSPFFKGGKKNNPTLAKGARGDLKNLLTVVSAFSSPILMNRINSVYRKLMS